MIFRFEGMPPKFLNVLSEKIGAARKTTENGNHLLVDCANRTSLPNVEFWFGEAKVSLARDAYSWTYRVSIEFSLHFF